MGFNWLYFLNNDEINYGIEVQGFKTDFEYFNYAKRQINQTENTTEIGIFFRYKKIINKLIIDPSVRLQYYASISEFSPEPRLGLKYNLSDNIRLKAAGGLYAQNLIAANSDRDVVNFFYGFLSAPDDLPSEFDGKSVKKNCSLPVMLLLVLNMISISILILTSKVILKILINLPTSTVTRFMMIPQTTSTSPTPLRKVLSSKKDLHRVLT